MIRIGIKPLSVNEAFQGRRYKTPAYKQYERDVMMLLPVMTVPDGNLSATFEFGFSNKASDIDNPVKLCADILAKKYGFDDRVIYEMTVRKKIVAKGDEYVAFKLEAIN